MASRQPPQLLSYSFLDILACTVAAVLFVLMVLALRLAEVSPQSLPQAELFELQTRRTELREALEGPSAEEREQELERLRAQANALEKRLRETQNKTRKAHQTADRRIKKLGRERRTTVRSLEPRATQLTTKKPGVAIDVHPGHVNVVNVRADPPSGSPPVSVMKLEVRQSIRAGAISASRGPLAQVLDRLDPDQVYVHVFLRTGAIPTFLKLRKALVSRGFELDWRPTPQSGLEFSLQFRTGWKDVKQGARTD